MISCLRSNFYDQYSSDVILSQGHLIVVSVSCNIDKDLDTSFEMSKFSKKEPTHLCKFCDIEGATQLFLRSDHFVSSTISYLLLGLNLMPTTLCILQLFSDYIVEIKLMQ